MLDRHVVRTPSSRILRLSILAVGLALTVSIASFAAQSQFATVSGVVHDQLGGTLPNVTLRMTHALSGAKHEITSAESGGFEFVGARLCNSSFLAVSISSCIIPPLRRQSRYGVVRGRHGLGLRAGGRGDRFA